jgi:hypothetical protein
MKTELEMETKKNVEMIQYTGTKTIKANPMKMGEAYVRGLLQRDKVLTREEATIDGYLVEYEDGYQSWSPADVFNRTYKPSETVLDRLRIERDELASRYDSLQKFLSGGLPGSVFQMVGQYQFEMLVEQRAHMLSYIKVLDSRIMNLERGSNR